MSCRETVQGNAFSFALEFAGAFCYSAVHKEAITRLAANFILFLSSLSLFFLF